MIIAAAKSSVILGLTALLSTGLVTLTHTLTKAPIAEQQKQHLLQLLNQVIPQHKYDNLLYESCTLTTNENLGTEHPMPVYIARKDGRPTAMAVEAIAPNGYNGNITILVAVDTHSTTLGVRVLQHNETPGLGDKIELNKSDWIHGFTDAPLASNKDAAWEIKKDGGKFDQFTGATITPRAVIHAARKAAWYLISHMDTLAHQPFDCGEKK